MTGRYTCQIEVSIKTVHNRDEPASQANYSTVTDFAKFRGWSTSQPRRTAMW
jgi:hypothetical protein